jgi:polysaccharide biosynthesis/export protein
MIDLHCHHLSVLDDGALGRLTRWLLLPAAALGLATGGCGASLGGGPDLATASAIDQANPARVDGPRDIVIKGEEARQAKELSNPADPGSGAYKIGPLDVVDVSVFQAPELSKTVQVAADGTINLPLVGTVPAAGRTPNDVERDLTQRLGRKYLQSPQVNIYIKEYNSQRVTVDGSVKKPGVYPLRGPSTLLQTIAGAEGFTDTADSTVVVFRTAKGARSAAKFDVADIRSGKAKDPEIVQGDVIVVSNSTMKESYQALLKILPVTSLFVSIL